VEINSPSLWSDELIPVNTTPLGYRFETQTISIDENCQRDGLVRVCITTQDAGIRTVNFGKTTRGEIYASL
jgi:hypothetical protein